MKELIISIISLLYFMANLNAQVFLKTGVGLSITETYKNDFAIQNQEFLYGQAINYTLGVGLKKDCAKMTLQIDYFEQEHDINIKMFDLQVDGLRFTSPVISAGVNMQYQL